MIGDILFLILVMPVALGSMYGVTLLTSSLPILISSILALAIPMGTVLYKVNLSYKSKKNIVLFAVIASLFGCIADIFLYEKGALFYSFPVDSGYPAIFYNSLYCFVAWMIVFMPFMLLVCVLGRKTMSWGVMLFVVLLTSAVSFTAEQIGIIDGLWYYVGLSSFWYELPYFVALRYITLYTTLLPFVFKLNDRKCHSKHSAVLACGFGLLLCAWTVFLYSVEMIFKSLG